MKGIIVERLDTITIIRINRPEKRNAIDYDTAIEMGNGSFLNQLLPQFQGFALLAGLKLHCGLT